MQNNPSSMKKNPSANKRRGFGTREIKALIVALALFISVGFWGVFSKQLINDAANAAAGLNAPAPTDPAPQPTDPLVINFPPLPTLVPYSGLKDSGQSSNPEPLSAGPAPQPAAVKVAAAPVTGKILLGGAAPSAPSSQGGGSGSSSGRKGTVTKTRSSKP
jgi:hypothetical protein